MEQVMTLHAAVEDVYSFRGLEARVRQEEGATVVALLGAAVSGQLDAMDRAFMQIAATRPRLAIVDLSNVELLSSDGLGLLFELRAGLLMHGGEVRLAGAVGATGETIRLTRLDVIFPVFETVEDAMGL